MSSAVQKQQSNIKEIAQEIFIQSQRNWNKKVIEEILELLNQQYPIYQHFRYLGNGGFSIVLQATNSKKEKVALKITEYKPKPQIQRKKEFNLLKQVFKSQYIVKVKEFFYLREQDEQQVQSIKYENQDENDQCYRYEVIEMELCQQNLRKLLQYFRDSKTKLSENQKEIIAIQMLDSVNLIHSKLILHRDIKPENFLTSISHPQDLPFVLKLSDLGLASNLNEKKSKSQSFASGMKGSIHYMSQEALDGKHRKQSDLFSLGIVLIELDNYDILDYSKVSIIESIRKEGISALKSLKINQKSLIFQIAKIFLDPQYQKRKSAIEMLGILISQKGYQNIPLYSVITQANVHSLMIDNLPSQLTLQEIKSAIIELYNHQKFSLLTFLGQGQSGVVFFAVNLKFKRECALKISSAENKSNIMRQISVLSRCHSPYISKFYGYQFFKDQNNNEFVVFEFEKCLCTLTQFLEQDKLEQQERKTRLAVQIIDSVALLHQQNVLHGDIKLDNFLISEDEEGRDIVKLIDFDQAGILNPDKNFDDIKRKGDLVENQNCLYLGGGSQAYWSPERYHSHDKPSTKLSDGFSIGLCLLLLDNFEQFFLEFFCQQSQLLFPYEQPYQRSLKLLNLESKIYEWAFLLLAFDPKKRLFPQEIVDKMIEPPTPLYSIWNNKFPLKKEYLEAPCLFLEGIGYSELEKQAILFSTPSNLKSLNIRNIQTITQIPLFQFISILPELASLNLNFSRNKLTSQGVGNLFKSISKLSSLSFIHIDLCNNSISNEGEQNIYQDLSALISLLSFNLNLQGNKLTNIGVGNLFKSISKLSFLSSLQINLWGNLITNQREGSIYVHLSTLTSLSSLNLNFYGNKLTSLGVLSIFKSISKLSSLSSLEICFGNNSIRNEGEENIFSHLSALTLLSQLNLNFYENQLTSYGVGHLFSSISKITSLSSLQMNLWSNSITNEGEEKIYQDLSSLTSLSLLNLNFENNKLTSIGVSNLFKGISKLSSLSTLEINLSDNQIENEGEENIYQYLTALTLLASLNLNFNGNKLTSIGVGHLFKSLSKESSLSSLKIDFSNNSITNDGEENIFQDLSPLTQLSFLKMDFYENKVTNEGAGNLFKSISKLSSLTSLQIDLRYNSITDEKKLLNDFNSLKIKNNKLMM